MKLKDLEKNTFFSQLEKIGISIASGPFNFSVKSPFESVADSLALMYADHSVVPGNNFVDFYTEIKSPSLTRKFFRPQCRFYFDGEAPFYPLPREQAFAAFEWGLNWVISNHAHQYLILHAAVVEKDGHALVMPGEPGSGKSTLCTALCHHGWRLLSDELTLIHLNSLKAVPLCRPISLKNKSIEVIADYLGDACVMGPTVNDTSKGIVAHVKPPKDSVHRMGHPVKISWFVFPRYQKNADPVLQIKNKAETFLEIAKNAFNYSFHGKNGLRVLKEIVSSTSSYRLEYSQLEDAEELLNTLEAPVTVAPKVRVYSAAK